SADPVPSPGAHRARSRCLTLPRLQALVVRDSVERAGNLLYTRCRPSIRVLHTRVPGHACKSSTWRLLLLADGMLDHLRNHRHERLPDASWSRWRLQIPAEGQLAPSA